MRDGFERYRAELDRVQLTERSKQALVENLTHRRSRTADGPRLAAGLRHGLAAAAAVCLLAAAGSAALVSQVPTMRDLFFGGDSVGYAQSGSFVGKAVENNGWNLSITDCVGDSYYLYLGLELEAPEGTVLDAADYHFQHSQVRFTDSSLYGTWEIRPLPDGDPTDNKLSLMWLLSSSQPGVNGATVRLKVSDFGHNWRFGEDREKRYDLDCGGTWDFGYVTIHCPDSTLHRTPDVPVPVALDGPEGVQTLDAAVSKIEISPLALHVWISGESLILHHGPENPQPGDSYYDCMAMQEVLAYDVDGQLIAMGPGLELSRWPGQTVRGSRLGGGGCSGYHESEGYLWLVYGFHGLLDVGRVATVVVNGVAIPIQ